MNIIWRAVIGVSCMLLIFNPARADQITFQGLSGSSTWSDVQARFPNARRDRGIGCKPGEQINRLDPITWLWLAMNWTWRITTL